MITERRLAQDYQSFWKTVVPMASKYVRRENLQLTRFAEPLPSAAPGNRGVTNEVAFRLFAESRKEQTQVQQLRAASLDTAIKTALDFIRRFREFSRGELEAPGPEAVQEAINLAKRLESFVGQLGPRSVTILPEFPGCGWLDECSGDLLLDGTLCEVKASQERFRSRDLRQLLVYAALNLEANRYSITHLCLVNPRLGLFLREELGSLCMQVAGTGAPAVLAEIVSFVSEPNRLGETG